MQPGAIGRRAAAPAIDNPILGQLPEERRRRVLFVNADADLREVVTRVLEREDYDVRAVSHSGHAVLLTRNMRFDLVVAELSGPDVSGPILVDQLRRHCPEMAAVFFANPGTPEGVAHVLVRPFTRDDLLTEIELALSNVKA